MSAVLLVAHDAPREEWLARRRLGIGASEIAAVMGESPWESPFSLWWKKHNGWDTVADETMRVGTFLEPTIAHWFAEHGDPNGNLVIRTAGLYASVERLWQMATPDRLVYLACAECDGSGWADGPGAGYPYLECAACDGSGSGPNLAALLECKWVAASWDGWGEDGSDLIPHHYDHQVQWQMDVMGVDEAFVCALGPGGFRTFRRRRDDKKLVAMREQGRRFMESLANGDVPDIDDHAATLPVLRRLHPDIEDREQEIPAHIAQGWLRSKRYADLADKVGRRYAAELRAHLGTAKTAVVAGHVIARRTSNDQLRRAA